MNRSISLPLTLAVVLVSQVALGGCNKKEDVNTSTDNAASAPATSMGSTSAPMDSISSASAVAGANAASAAASDAAMAASR